LAGFFAFIWSNLCTRNIQKRITPRGHHDWPDKRALLTFDSAEQRAPVPAALSLIIGSFPLTSSKPDRRLAFYEWRVIRSESAKRQPATPVLR
jgi:hypothetical protein